MNRISLKASFLPLALLGFSTAHAQATHTFVSGAGSDASLCTRTAPCLTFAGAYAKTATGGEIDAIDAVDLGPIAITHAIVLDGGSNAAGLVATGTSGVTVNGGGSDIVTLRNLNITSASGAQSTGIAILNTGMIHLENVRVSGFQTGVNAAGFSTLSIDNSVLRDCVGGETGSGVALMLADSPSVSTVKNSEILNCGYGIQATSGVAAVTDTNISFNGVGVNTSGSALLSFDRTLISGSSTAGVQAGPGSTMQFSDSTLVNNLLGIAGAPYTGVVESYGNNRVKHNGTVGLFTRTLSLR